MANNRMYLVCNVCKPKDEDLLDGEEGALCLAKWYPCIPYYTNGTPEDKGIEMFEFFENHSHPEVASEGYEKGAGQENPVRLVYECDGLPVLEESH
jgi:hypothetical protein